MSPHTATLKLGEKSAAVGHMQETLISRGFLPRLNSKGRPNRDNDYGPLTMGAVLKFQAEMAKMGLLEKDEVVGHLAGPRTLSLLYGVHTDTTTPDWPARPDYKPLTEAGKRAMFGHFDYTPKTARTLKGDPITVLDRWVEENLQTVTINQLKGVPLYFPGNHERSSGRVTLHRLAVPVFMRFFEAVEAHGLLPLIRTYDGAYNPRFIRGSRTALSQHAYGTAIDLNGYANPIGEQPAAMGEDGCLLPLVHVATECGIYWGGFFSRKDGMHFEIARTDLV